MSGKGWWGGDHPTAHLSDWDVARIRLDYEPYVLTADMLAERYKTNSRYIRQILVFQRRKRPSQFATWDDFCHYHDLPLRVARRRAVDGRKLASKPALLKQLKKMRASGQLRHKVPITTINKRSGPPLEARRLKGIPK